MQVSDVLGWGGRESGLLKMKLEQLVNTNSQNAALTVRFLKKLVGSVAVLGKRTWLAPKAMSNNPPRVRSTMMRALFH